MKRIILPVVFLVFINIFMWIAKKPSEGLSLNRIFIPILSIMMIIMMVLVEHYRRRSLGGDKKSPRGEVK